MKQSTPQVFTVTDPMTGVPMPSDITEIMDDQINEQIDAGHQPDADDPPDKTETGEEP